MTQQSFHLIAHVLCPYVQRSIITLEEKGIPYTRTDIDLAKKPEWFKQKSPMEKVPILLIGDEHTLFESAVICEYLDEITPGSLHPVDSFEKAYHRSWIEFGSSILNDITSLYNAKDTSSFKIIHIKIQRKFSHIEKEISGSPFFIGETFHLIDAVYGTIFRYFEVFDTFINLKTFDNLPKCQTWLNALKQRSSIKDAVSKNYSNHFITFLKKRESHISRLALSNNKQHM
ncbi:MAG: glutathione S-transferase [Oceanicoccus sp.]|jgi:glutathione S-transferase